MIMKDNKPPETEKRIREGKWVKLGESPNGVIEYLKEKVSIWKELPTDRILKITKKKREIWKRK